MNKDNRSGYSSRSGYGNSRSYGNSCSDTKCVCESSSIYGKDSQESNSSDQRDSQLQSPGSSSSQQKTPNTRVSVATQTCPRMIKYQHKTNYNNYKSNNQSESGSWRK